MGQISASAGRLSSSELEGRTLSHLPLRWWQRCGDLADWIDLLSVRRAGGWPFGCRPPSHLLYETVGPEAATVLVEAPLNLLRLGYGNPAPI